MRKRNQRGFSLIELLIVIAIILIIVTVALPKLTQATRHAHDVAALKAVQTIHTAQVQYNSQFGRYAASLAELGPPASGLPNASAADLIPSSLAQGDASGFKFTMTGTQGGYIINAQPVTFGTSGSKTYYSDQSMVVHENDGPEPATATSKEVR
jgi:type IV pilus assembly protein PilA